MKLIIDSREQKPYIEFFNRLKYPYKIKKLNVGDYSIVGFEDKFSIERKSLPDFIKSITWELDRFERELVRAQNYDYFAIVIEADFYDIENRNYRADVHPSVILETMFKLSTKYNTNILLAGARHGGALAVIKLAEGYLKCRGGGMDGAK